MTVNGTLSVKNFEKFQHYKDRTPPWIKLYNDILDDYEFEALQDASKAHLILIWLLASRTGNQIPNDPQWIGRKIGATELVDVRQLIVSGFLVENQSSQRSERNASKPLGLARSRETEGEAETEGEKKEPRHEDTIYGSRSIGTPHANGPHDPLTGEVREGS